MPSILTAVRDLDRARQIAVVLVRHGFGEVVTRLGLSSGTAPKSDAEPSSSTSPVGDRATLAQRLRMVLTDLGPSFVKLGQIASTRPDLIPPDVIAELKKLQDAVPPFSSEDARAIIEEQLGAPVSEVFATFEDKPMASASIGQVHKATLRSPDGDVPVVVKVQRPNVAQTIERDVDLLYWFAHALERAFPETKTYSPTDLVREFDRSITAEIDFVQEAENAQRFAKNFEGHEAIRFPTIHKKASSKKILTMEFFDGPKIDRAKDRGFDGKVIAARSVDVIIKMIFEDGFFHADPHPGNVLVLGTPEAPILGMLDLGLVGHLSPLMRDRAIDLMVAAVREDYEAIADALYAMGKPNRKVDQVAYRADVAMLARKYLGKSLKDIEMSALITDLIQGAIRHGIDMPPDFLMVGKSLMTLEGIGRQLDPDLDVFNAAKPHFLRLLAKRYSPEKVSGDLLRAAVRMSGLAGTMPEQVGEILEDLRKGHLSMKTVDPGLPLAAERLGKQVYTGLTVASMVFAGGLLLATDRHVWLGYLLFVGAGVTAFFHQIRQWWTGTQLRSGRG
ncbi:MAG: AarF/ABC1/UbiB kinase family protein [Myxococcales bacterium]|nr:AarF/ABC1/UbiB kinase family protein [Myxococcales bacterium]